VTTSNKTVLPRELGVSRSTLYYESKIEEKDWKLKNQVEAVLRQYPSYGSRRIALAIGRNRKPIRRAMQKYGIKPYRRCGRKRFRRAINTTEYHNLLHTTYPIYPNHIWSSDFTYLKWKHLTVYVCTVMDFFSRKIVGLEVLTNNTIRLTISALLGALLHHGRPDIFHSDNGREYDAKDFKYILTTLNILISRSKKGCPWENGYQESFYSHFKVDLGDPNRFETLGELIFAIYQTIYTYNNHRIHSALKCSPAQFLTKKRS
jgi:putative transposase